MESSGFDVFKDAAADWRLERVLRQRVLAGVQAGSRGRAPPSPFAPDIARHGWLGSLPLPRRRRAPAQHGGAGADSPRGAAARPRQSSSTGDGV